MFNIQPTDGTNDLRKSGTSARSLGIWYKVVFKALSLWLVKIQPALGHEGMRIGVDLRVDLKKGGSHATNRLRDVSGRQLSESEGYGGDAMQLLKWPPGTREFSPWT